MVKINGYVAILVSPDGEIIGKGTSFKKKCPSGYSKIEYNQIIARENATRDAMKYLMWHKDLQDLSDYLSGRIIGHLTDKGYKFEYVNIEQEQS